MADIYAEQPQQVFAAQSAQNTAGQLDNVYVKAYHTLFVVSGGGVSGGVVNIELSNDNATWFAPASNTVTTNAATSAFAVTVGPHAFQYVRARISTAITGGTVTAWVSSV